MTDYNAQNNEYKNEIWNLLSEVERGRLECNATKGTKSFGGAPPNDLVNFLKKIFCTVPASPASFTSVQNFEEQISNTTGLQLSDIPDDILFQRILPNLTIIEQTFVFEAIHGSKEAEAFKNVLQLVQDLASTVWTIAKLGFQLPIQVLPTIVKPDEITFTFSIDNWKMCFFVYLDEERQQKISLEFYRYSIKDKYQFTSASQALYKNTDINGRYLDDYQKRVKTKIQRFLTNECLKEIVNNEYEFSIFGVNSTIEQEQHQFTFLESIASLALWKSLRKYKKINFPNMLQQPMINFSDLPKRRQQRLPPNPQPNSPMTDNIIFERSFYTPFFQQLLLVCRRMHILRLSTYLLRTEYIRFQNPIKPIPNEAFQELERLKHLMRFQNCIVQALIGHKSVSTILEKTPMLDLIEKRNILLNMQSSVILKVKSAQKHLIIFLESRNDENIRNILNKDGYMPNLIARQSCLYEAIHRLDQIGDLKNDDGFVNDYKTGCKNLLITKHYIPIFKVKGEDEENEENAVNVNSIQPETLILKIPTLLPKSDPSKDIVEYALDLHFTTPPSVESGGGPHYLKTPDIKKPAKTNKKATSSRTQLPTSCFKTKKLRSHKLTK